MTGMWWWAEDGLRSSRSSVPTGLALFNLRLPSTGVLGYQRASLRDSIRLVNVWRSVLISGYYFAHG